MKSAIPIENLLPRLDRVNQIADNNWKACCPAHSDKSPSLSVRECGDGTVLLKCWSGCSADSICHAVGLELRDLFPPRPHKIQSFHCKNGLTYSERRKLNDLIEFEKLIISIATEDFFAFFAGKKQISDADCSRALLAFDRLKKWGVL